VHTVDLAPEDSYGILAWTMLFINIYTVYVREFEVAKLFPVTHSPTFPRYVTLIIISNQKETGVYAIANWFGPMDEWWRFGGTIRNLTLCGRY